MVKVVATRFTKPLRFATELNELTPAVDANEMSAWVKPSLLTLIVGMDRSAWVKPTLLTLIVGMDRSPCAKPTILTI
jgi:hypothetical protein